METILTKPSKDLDNNVERVILQNSLRMTISVEQAPSHYAFEEFAKLLKRYLCEQEVMLGE